MRVGASATLALGIAAALLAPALGALGVGPGLASPTAFAPSAMMSRSIGIDHAAPFSTAVGPQGPASTLTWPMFLHDPARTGANLAESTLAPGNTSALQKLWSFTSGGAVTGSTVVANGSIYFGAWNGDLYGVSSLNGSLEWKTALPGKADYTGCNEPGIAATPVLWNNTLYIGGGNPWLYAVNATTGSVLWHVDLANVSGASSPWTAHKIWSSAVVYNGSLYVGDASGCDSPLIRGALFQISLATHVVTHVFWTLPAGQIGPGIWSSPSIDPATNTVWVTTGNEGTSDTKYARSLVELNASNVSQVLGYKKEGAVFQDLDFGDGASLFHSSNDTAMVVAINKNGIAYAFNESDLASDGLGPTAWTRTVSSSGAASYAPPAFDGHTLYIGTVPTTIPGVGFVSGSVLALDPDNGSVRWWVGLPASVYGGLAFADGLLWVGDTTDTLHALNASTGTQVAAVKPGAVWTEPTVLNGEVFCPTGDYYTSPTTGAVTAYGLPTATNATAVSVPGTPNSTYDFRAGVTGGVQPINVSWDFGDGTSGYGSAPVHAYGGAGSFPVTETARDARGVTATANLTVTATAPLTATAYEPTNPMNLGAGAFIGVNAAGGTTPYEYNWSGLPPGSHSVNATPDLFLVQPYYEGLYQVSVVVSSPSGQSVRVGFAPLYIDGPLSYTLIASPPSGVLPLTVSFSALSSFPNATGSYVWSFGDGNGSTAVAPSHTYVLPAIYTVTLTVTYPGGSVATATDSIAAFDPLVVTPPGPVTIDLGAAATLSVNATGGGGAYEYAWSGLPSGCLSQNSSLISCVPTESGGFAIAVTVTDPIGGTDTVYATLVVNPVLSLGAAVTHITPPSCTSPAGLALLELAATASGGQTPYVFHWQGQGATNTTAPDPTFSVPAPGAYTYRVNVSDAFGSVAMTSFTATVDGPTCTPGAPASDFWSSPTGSVAIVLGLLIALVIAAAVIVHWRRRR